MEQRCIQHRAHLSRCLLQVARGLATAIPDVVLTARQTILVARVLTNVYIQRCARTALHIFPNYSWT